MRQTHFQLAPSSASVKETPFSLKKNVGSNPRSDPCLFFTLNPSLTSARRVWEVLLGQEGVCMCVGVFWGFQ